MTDRQKVLSQRPDARLVRWDDHCFTANGGFPWTATARYQIRIGAYNISNVAPTSRSAWRDAAATFKDNPCNGRKAVI